MRMATSVIVMSNKLRCQSAGARANGHEAGIIRSTASPLKRSHGGRVSSFEYFHYRQADASQHCILHFDPELINQILATYVEL